jgi:hypothetical protein
MNNYESAAMWEGYGREGVAVRSTYRLLCESIRGEPAKVHVGRVIYRDNILTPDHRINTLLPCLRKRMSFECERELRAIVLQTPPRWKSGSFPYGRYVNRKPKGIPIVCDLDRLIEKVYVAPESRGWIKQLVGKVMKTYDLDKPLETSDLEKRPELR